MQKFDLVIVLVGILALASALGGAAVLGSSSQSALTYQVGWTTNQSQATPVTGTVGTGGGTGTLAWTLTRANLTRVDLTVLVTASGPQVGADDVAVKVTLPSGSTVSKSGTIPAGGTSTKITLSVPLASVPTIASIQAASPHAALRALAGNATSTLGTGNWTAAVTVTPTGVGSVGGHSVKLTATLASYRAHVSETGAGVR